MSNLQSRVDGFNARYRVGTPVLAYPGCRPEADKEAPCLLTRTRSKATVLEGHTPVVWVDGHSACIALTHVDPFRVTDTGPVAGAVREERCLREPIGCGRPLVADTDISRVFWSPLEAARYETEWQITGLCPDCQDRINGGDDE